MTKEFWIGKEIGKREEANARAVQSWRPLTATELADKYRIVKYICEDGSCRLDLDMDVFKDLFAVGERQRFVADLIVSMTDEEYKKVPQKIKDAFEFLLQDAETAKIAWHAIRGECKYDNRKKNAQ